MSEASLRAVERESPLDVSTASSESLPALIARMKSAPPRVPVVSSLLMAGEVLLCHGQPRTLKSWFVNELALAVAVGAAVAGFFLTSLARAVLIVSNEDSEQVYVDRFRGLLAGRHSTAPPAGVRFLVGRGVSLDSPKWRRRLQEEVLTNDIALVVLDPLRSVCAGTDQGPTEIRDVMLWLRLLMQTTGASVLAVHHDVKPLPGVTDTRRRAQRASGGGLFSHVDGAISFETIGDNETLCVPDGFKHRGSPDAFRVRLETEQDAYRVVAAPATGAAPDQIALHAKILDALRDSTGGASGRALAKRLHSRREDVQGALEHLLSNGQVDCADGPRRAKLWCVRS